MAVLLETSLGNLVIDLHVHDCPVTTKNFLKLCKVHYFDNVLFFNVQKDFIAQTGDPTGTGRGGTSIFGKLYGDQARFMDDEIRKHLKHDKLGTVSMANSGPHTNTSQFFFTLRDDIDYLDGKHTVFGSVAEGHDVLHKINELFLDDDGRPLQDVRIKRTHVLDDPFPDPSGLVVPSPSPAHQTRPKEETVPERISVEEPATELQRSEAEVEASLREKEARSRAVVLEMIGDLPDADIKPPENVLFVAKLNPVTQDEDLELIFSRFGEIKSCEIIRDFKTGDSLCYAFIEFETPEQSEQAYFKMNNVLIDDRRIKVDFSQSVAKLWNKYANASRARAAQQPRLRHQPNDQRGYKYVFDETQAVLEGGEPAGTVRPGTGRAGGRADAGDRGVGRGEVRSSVDGRRGSRDVQPGDRGDGRDSRRSREREHESGRGRGRGRDRDRGPEREREREHERERRDRRRSPERGRDRRGRSRSRSRSRHRAHPSDDRRREHSSHRR